MLQTALIGTGIGTEVYAPIIEAHSHYQLHTVVSQDFGEAKTVKKKFKAKNASDDWKEVVADPEIDVVFICTPPYSHFEIAHRALEQGKHILITPPMAMDANEAEVLTDLAEQKNLYAVVDQQKTYQSARKYVQQLIREGKIGSLTRISRTLKSKERFSNKASGIWRWKQASGGGVMAEQLSIDFDFLLRVSGGVHSIQALRSTVIPERINTDGTHIEVDSDDQFYCEARFHNDVRATMLVHKASPGRSIDEIVFYGTEGVLVLSNDTDAIFYNYDNPDKRDRLAIPPRFQIHSVPGTISYASNYFLVDLLSSAIFNDTPISPTFDEALHIRRIIDAAQKSSNEQRWIEIGSTQVIPQRSESQDVKRAGFVTKIYE